ncbi:proteasome activator complex subunit 4B-like isoform X1 [Anopheles merus]|uniref:Proteasome activator complex subunit 4 C-terminal domain-containing protein n=1 Tax=Anopheles merus TaxID=30066 RepID=A0A182VJL8_ANOME|nr:proteasome activator complex subunit 4B-like isoform X1 [Anopheles merus]
MAQSLSTESCSSLSTLAETDTTSSTVVDDESSDSIEQNRPKRNERHEKLGFKPQKELFCNKFLPYTEKLDDESQANLERIKNNLGKAVAMREMGPAVMLNIRNLVTYIKLYGMKFSKEDHVKFVQLLLEMLVIPKLDPDAINKISEAIFFLLRKREWLSTEDLQIEWRPLYDLFHLVVSRLSKKGELFNTTSKNRNESTKSPLALLLEAAAEEMGYDVSTVAQYLGIEMDANGQEKATMEANLQCAIQVCTPYFPPSAMQEILDELMPRIQPLDNGSGCEVVTILNIFLNYEQGYELWFDKLMSIWNAYHNPPWAGDLMTMFAVVGLKNIGHIDWEPHIPTMFARITRAINFPVNYRNTKGGRANGLQPDAIATWIVSALGPRSSAQQYLSTFMSTIESYLHPANTGKWVKMLGEILILLPRFFIDRLVVERYRKGHHIRPIPSEHKLTEECITAFVECMKPVALQAMYSRLNPQEVGKIFQCLADLRPALIIPTIIERVYTSLDSLTEPRKLTAALHGLIGVSRALVSGHKGYTEGRTHVIPLFLATLPGIDGNDLMKTVITFQFLTSVAFLIPIIDCSQAGQHHTNLTDDERLLCEQTADFESFALQYLDRLFLLIENSSTNNVRMEQSDLDTARSKAESLLEPMVQTCTHGIMGQSSDKIVAAAAKKLMEFVQTRLFEQNVAGQLVGCLVRLFARIHGREVLRVLLPHVLRLIEDYMGEHDEVEELEKHNDEMLYYLVLLSNLVRGDPRIIRNYVDDLLPTLDRLAKFKCKRVARYLAQIVGNLMNNMSTVQTMDIRNSPDCFQKPLSEIVPVKRWGEKMAPDGKIEWRVPDEGARAVCERIMHRYLPGLLAKLEQHSAGEVTLPREELHRSVMMVQALIRCYNFLPNWTDEEPMKLFETCVDLRELQLNVTLGFEGLEIRMPGGENVRKAIIRTIARLQDRLLEVSEDDTQTLKAIVTLYEKVLLRKHPNGSYEMQLKTFNSTKRFQTYQLTRCKRDVRAVVVTRVIIQQDCRDEMSLPLFSATHLEVMKKLLELSVSYYSTVRIEAQAKLHDMLYLFPYAYPLLTDRIVECLQLDANTNHERFKGILCLLFIKRRGRLISQNNWEYLARVWPALLRSKLSEKPSIVKLVDGLKKMIDGQSPTYLLEVDIGEKVVERALALRTRVDELDLAAGQAARARENKRNMELFQQLIADIVQTVETSKLHLRYHYLASVMLINLCHPYAEHPPSVTRLTVHHLIHDSVTERKLAIQLLLGIFRQQKRPQKKCVMNPLEIVARLAGQDGGSVPPNPGSNVAPGYRDDNMWLQYDVARVPKSQAEWDEPRYMYTVEGCFGWTQGFKMYAPSAEQPKLDRTVDELSEHERTIFEFFDQQENVDTLMRFWSLEEKKGRDEFSGSRMLMIKMLFKLFGDRLLDRFLCHMKRLIEDKATESNHRCAVEVMTGIMRGAKHWPYEKTRSMYERLVPLIRLGMQNVTVDTDMYWGMCFATAAQSMDPSKQHWLHEVLLEDPLQDANSFSDCNRLYCLQGAFNQHVWRMASVAHRLLDYLKPHLDHPFQSLRERLGNTLINIFEGDLRFEGYECRAISPQRSEMIAYVMPKLAILLQKDPEPPKPKLAAAGEMQMEVEGGTPDEDSEYVKAVRLFKTIAHWITYTIHRYSNGNEKEYFELLPIACRLERSEQDQELSEICTLLLAFISQALTLPNCMDVALAKIDEVSKMSFWSARRAVIDVLQVQVFYNMTIILSRPEWKAKVQEIVLRLLEDSVVEVREKAAEVLCGLVHCSFLTATEELLELFKRKCRTKIIRSKRIRVEAASCSSEVARNENAEANAVLARHTGVLGLCAFISAYPYEVPEFVPNVFEHLGAHLNDPQPIPATIRKTMGDFKRTHHDNWEVHQLKFTEDQLAVLSDLTIPPSYYA